MHNLLPASIKKATVVSGLLATLLGPIVLLAQQPLLSNHSSETQFQEDKFTVTDTLVTEAVNLPVTIITSTTNQPASPPLKFSEVLTNGLDNNVYLPIVLNNFVDYFDNFSNSASGWPIADTSTNLYQYNNGEYRILNKTNAYVAAATAGNRLIDFEVSVDVRREGSARGAYGFAFGITDNWDEYFLYLIWPDSQEFSLYRYHSGEGFTLMLHGNASEVRPGNEVNHLQLKQYQVIGWFGTFIERYAYINGYQYPVYGEKLTFTDERRVGLVAVPIDAGHDVRFDNYHFKNHPIIHGG